jgi:hypothetical protein
MAAEATTMRALAVRPGVPDCWLERLLTTPVQGLADPGALVAALEDDATIKAHVEISAPTGGTP